MSFMKKQCWKGKITQCWKEKREEIIKEVAVPEPRRQNDKKSKTQVGDCKVISQKVRKNIIPFIIGMVYIFIGIFIYLIPNAPIFCDLKGVWENSVFFSFELIILGQYSVLYGIIAQLGSNDNRYQKKSCYFILTVALALMLPYHLIIRFINKLLNLVRQKHVAYLFPYYLLSIFAVLLLFSIAAIKVPTLKEFVDLRLKIKLNDEAIAFIIVFVSICLYFKITELFAWLSTRSVVRSVQKSRLKRESKNNWRGTMKDELYRNERKENMRKEWEVVRAEIQYSKLYFYILLNVIILCSPIGENEFLRLIVNEIVGVTTLAALAREVRSSMKNEAGKVEM